ncbi:hypothetical protein ACTE26_003665, partial [Escherichia coli]
IVRLNAHIETLNNALSGNTESALAELSRENAQLRHSLRLAEMNANFVSSHYGQVIETRRQDIQAAGGIITAIHDGKEKVRKVRSNGGKNSHRPGKFEPFIRTYLDAIEAGEHTSTKTKPVDDFINWLEENYKDAVTEHPDGLVELAVEDDDVRTAQKDSIRKSITAVKKKREADDN